MIYTGYFSKIKSYPKSVIPVSIAAKTPKYYAGLCYKKLSPTYDTLMNYKKNYNKEQYIERYNNEVLSKLNPSKVVLELLNLVENHKGIMCYPEIILVCYENNDNFCHRHLVANWLNENGHEVREYIA